MIAHTFQAILRPATPKPSPDDVSNLPPSAASFSFDKVTEDLKRRLYAFLQDRVRVGRSVSQLETNSMSSFFGRTNGSVMEWDGQKAETTLFHVIYLSEPHRD